MDPEFTESAGGILVMNVLYDEDIVLCNDYGD